MNMPTPKPGILDIAPYVGGISKVKGIDKAIKLSSNEAALGPSLKAIEACKAAAGSLFRYPDSAAMGLREAIADVERLPFENLICGAGSDELIHLLAAAYAGEGDEVLYSEHGFLMYQIYAKAAGATPVSAPEKHLTTSVDSLLAAANDNTKLVFVANPNNPTGSYISGNELRRLRDGLPSHTILVIDGAYSEYLNLENYSDGREMVATTNNTVMLRTFSKIYGLASLRIGWAYVPENIINVLHRVRGPFNVSTPAIAAATSAMRDVEWTAKAKQHNTRELKRMAAFYQSIGLIVHPSVGNFILVESKEGAEGIAKIYEHLKSHAILTRKVENYGLPSCLRITIGTEDENNALISALEQFSA